MAQGIGIEEIIDIQTEAQSGGTVRAEFGTGLLLTATSTDIPARGSGKCQRFGSQAAVSEKFGTHSIVNDAQVWFGADPSPKALYIGRWAADDVDTYLVSGAIDHTLNDIKAVTDGSFRFNNSNATAINFSTATDFTSTTTGVVKILADAINGISGVSGANVTWDASTKKFTIGYNTADDLGEFTAISPSTGTDLAAFLNLAVNNTDDTAEYFQGTPRETLATAVSLCADLAVAGPPTALMLGSDAPDTFGTGSTNTKTAMELVAQAGDYMTARLETATSVLTVGEETSALWNTFASSRSHVIPIYSRGTFTPPEVQAPRPDIGVMAKLSSQNFDLPQSIITLVPKPLENVGTTDINETQLAELVRKQASVLTTVGGLPSLLGGWTGKSGVWADAQWWLLWLKNEMERSIFEAMRSSKRLSVAQLRDTITGVMAKAVNSGGAKPGGVVSDVIKHDIRAVTGNHDFDGVMSNGYVLWIDPPQQQTPTDRAARIARFKVWVAPSEAIHSVAGGIVLSG